MAKEKTITFTHTVQYETEGRKKGPTYNRGDVQAFREDIADRWIKRGVAVEGRQKIDADPPAQPAEAPQRTADADKVQISEEYRKQGPAALVALASQLWSAPPKSTKEAVEIIEAELKLRADAAKTKASSTTTTA